MSNFCIFNFFSNLNLYIFNYLLDFFFKFYKHFINLIFYLHFVKFVLLIWFYTKLYFSTFKTWFHKLSLVLGARRRRTQNNGLHSLHEIAAQLRSQHPSLSLRSRRRFDNAWLVHAWAPLHTLAWRGALRQAAKNNSDPRRNKLLSFTLITDARVPRTRIFALQREIAFWLWHRKDHRRLGFVGIPSGKWFYTAPAQLSHRQRHPGNFVQSLYGRSANFRW